MGTREDRHGATAGRALGPGEHAFFLLDRSLPTNIVGMAELEGPLEEEVLRAALDAAQERHPLTHARLTAPERQRPALVLDAPRLPLTVVRGQADAWVALAEHELHQPLVTPRGPLARAVWIRHAPAHSTLLVTLHHGVADGRSAAIFLGDVLRAAGRMLRGESASLEPLPLRDSLEAHLPRWAHGPGGWMRAAGAFVQEAFHLAGAGWPRQVPTNGGAPVTERRTRLLPRTLDAESTARLVHAARLHGTTVQGALCAAVLLAVRDELTGTDPVPMVSFSPIDMRSRLEPPLGEEIGLFVSASRSLHRVGPETRFWPLAQEIRQALVTSLRRREPFLLPPAMSRLYGALARVAPEGARGDALFARMAEAAQLCTTGVSNLGVLEPVTDSGPLHLRSLSVTASLATIWTFLSLAITCAGSLHWNFMFQEPIISAPRARRLVEGSLRHLQDALGEERRHGWNEV
jgi:hypothetical protein